MTATFETMTNSQPGPRTLWTARDIDLPRLVRQVVGATLVILALGMLLAPTAQSGNDVVALKLGVSMFLSVAGLILVQDHDRTRPPAIEIDIVRREVRLVKRRGWSHRVVERISIRDLGQAEIAGDVIRLSAANGTLLADVTLHDATVRASLCNALQDAGKL